jgi:hypothetical protein
MNLAESKRARVTFHRVLWAIALAVVSVAVADVAESSGLQVLNVMCTVTFFVSTLYAAYHILRSL